MRSCVKSSYRWDHVETLSLSTNMRVLLSRDQKAAAFSGKLLQLSEGYAPNNSNGFVELTNVANIIGSSQLLIETVFTNMERNYTNAQWLCERVILAPKNTDVAEINKKRLLLILGDSRVYKYVDKPCDPSEAVQYPVEFLNSLRPSGLPPHELHLKTGAPIIAQETFSLPKLLMEHGV